MYSDSQLQLSIGQMAYFERIDGVQKSQRQFGELSGMFVSVSIRQSANHLRLKGLKTRKIVLDAFRS